jgi:hypothetical protein
MGDRQWAMGRAGEGLRSKYLSTMDYAQSSLHCFMYHALTDVRTYAHTCFLDFGHGTWDDNYDNDCSPLRLRFQDLRP